MNRKNKPLTKRIVGTICSIALVGACFHIFFTGLDFLSGLVMGLTILSIGTPVVVSGGGISEILTGLIEAFIEGIMGVFDAITGLFNI